MMLSNRDLSTTIRWNWILLLTITVLCIAGCKAVKNETALDTSKEIEASSESEENTELATKEKPYTSVWTMMYDFWNWMIGGYAQNKNAVGEPRTFGAIRRLQWALIPIVFKFGVMSAMVTLLVFLALKTVLLLKMLLLLNAAAIFAKILLHKSDSHPIYYPHPQPPWGGYSGWSSGPVGPWAEGPSPLNKEVHLHIHGSNLSPHPGLERADYGYNTNLAYPYYDTTSELSNRGPLPYLRSSKAQPNGLYTNGGG